MGLSRILPAVLSVFLVLLLTVRFFNLDADFPHGITVRFFQKDIQVYLDSCRISVSEGR